MRRYLAQKNKKEVKKFDHKFMDKSIQAPEVSITNRIENSIHKQFVS
jgi:hypothetical protein